jgi:hypothetical protein
MRNQTDHLNVGAVDEVLHITKADHVIVHVASHLKIVYRPTGQFVMIRAEHISYAISMGCEIYYD